MLSVAEVGRRDMEGYGGVLCRSHWLELNLSLLQDYRNLGTCDHSGTKYLGFVG